MTDPTTTAQTAAASETDTLAANASADAVPPAAAPETVLADAAITAATPLVEEAATDLRSKLVAEGHALIDRHLGLAKRIADLQPAVRPLLPLISACLHDLFAHMTAAPQASSIASPSSASAPASGPIDHVATAAVVDPAPTVVPKT